MWERAGIIRCAESLSEARTKLREWAFILNLSFTTRRELELQNMIEVSQLITDSAMLRKSSVGAHYRSDFPAKNEGWDAHIIISKEEPRYEFIR